MAFFSAKEEIKRRKSIRTFDREPVKKTDTDLLEHFFGSRENPFGADVEFRILDAKKYKLSSPVISGAKLYMAAKIKRVKNYEIALGYGFEEVCLFAQHLNIGSVMLASTLNRKAFEEAMEVSEGEVMPVASPIGYPAERMSLREILMRKSLKSDERLPFGELFYDKSFGTSLKEENAGRYADALSAVVRAPSAANKQPWRCVVSDENTVHFYEKKTMKDSPLGDVQKVDMGIALCHFNLVMEEEGSEGAFVDDDPCFAVPENVHYITTYKFLKGSV